MFEKIELVIVLISISMLILTTGFVMLFVFFYNSKKKQLEKQQEKELQYLQELSNTKSEIQNETLNHIGRELHDNVGQLLAVAKIHTNSLIKTSPSNKLNEVNNALAQSIEEVRAISHSLNADRINSFGLLPALKSEIERLKSLRTITVHDKINIDEQFELDSDKEIMLYRITQEFISNTLKYAQAQNLKIDLSFKNDTLEVKLSDDGLGFDHTVTKEGTGLSNIRHRSNLIGAQFSLTSNLGNGTQLNISLPKIQNP